MNKHIKKQAKVTLTDIITKKHVQGNDSSLSDLWWPFHNSLMNLRRTFPEGSIQRGLTAFAKSAEEIQVAELLDLAAGTCVYLK